MNWKVIFVGVWMMIAYRQGAFAQTLSYRQYTIHDGLPQIQITTLFKDSRGFLWVGTKGGICKFNGESFENIHYRGKPIVRQFNRIWEDRKGYVWFATSLALYRYDGKTVEQFLMPKSIWGVMPAKDDGLLVLLDNTTVKYFSEGRLIPASKAYSNLQDSCVWGIWGGSSKDSIFYQVRDNCDRDKLSSIVLWQRGPVDTLFSNSKEVFYNLVSNVKEYKGNASNTEAWAVFKTEVSKARKERHFILHKGNWKPAHATPFLVAGDSAYWFKNDSLGVTDLQSGASHFLMTLKNHHTVILEDGNQLWVSSDNGLYQVFLNGFRQVSHPSLTYVWGIGEGADGQLYFANYKGKFVAYQNGRFKEIPIHFSYQDNRLLDVFGFGSSRDADSNLYFPEVGFLKWNGKNWKHLFSNQGRRNSFLFSFYDAKEQKVVGCEKGRLMVVDSLDNIEPVAQLDSTRAVHCRKFLVSGIRDSADNYWMGSFYGLNKYHIPTGKITYYLQEEGKLPFQGVECMATDARNRLWMGSHEGIGYWDYKGDSLVIFEQSIFNFAVENLKSVGERWLVIGGRQGIFILDLKALYEKGSVQLRHYNHRNGYLGIEPTQNCSFLDSKGNYWVASSNDLSYLPVSEFSTEKTISKIYITRVNEERLSWVNVFDRINLPKNKNELNIHFEGVGYNRPVMTEYAWKLEGVDEHFTEWTRNDNAIYTNLSPGTYRFRVKMRDMTTSDIEQMPEATIEIKVSMDFWKRPDFYWYALNGLLLAVILIGIIGWLNRRAMRETQEKERLLKYYQIQTLQSQLNPHFIFNLLQTIINRIRKEDKRQAENYMISLGKLLRNFLDSSVESNIEGKIVTTNQILLSKEIELLTMYLDLELLQARDAFTYDISVGEGVFPDAVFVTPMLIQPYVENAIKHGISYKNAFGHIWIRFYKSGDKLICTVEDDGVGRDKAREIQAKSEHIYKSRGDSLVKQRVKLLNDLGYPVKIETEDREGGGTVVTIIFPDNF